jgi:hypothetical protein
MSPHVITTLSNQELFAEALRLATAAANKRDSD